MLYVLVKWWTLVDKNGKLFTIYNTGMQTINHTDIFRLSKRRSVHVTRESHAPKTDEVDVRDEKAS